ncbi:MAG: insulinase family protein [Endomicrobium sp.]|nr:insulinase family protein [Endomicrobium sp.]
MQGSWRIGGCVESFTLSNGIKVLFDKTNGADIFSLRVLTPSSVISENFDNAGISNLTSKLAVYCTKSRSNRILNDELGNIGADLSSQTTYDTAGFGISCLSKYFDKAVELLADVVINSAFDEKEFSFEKENSIAALNSRRDNIGALAFDVFIKLFYGDVPYSFPIIGSKESILKISREDLLKWHAYSYNASNILISVCGNISSAVVRKSLEKHFSSVEAGKKFEEPVFDIRRDRSVKKEIKSKFKQSYIVKGFYAPAVLDKDFAAANVINALLGGRSSSRLFIELREKLGLAYEVGTVYHSMKKDSYFAVYIGLDKKNIGLVLEKIDEVLRDFCSTEVSSQELKNVKRYIKGTYLLDRQTVSRKSYCNAWREIIGQGYKYDLDYLSDIEGVTAHDVLSVAGNIFSGDAVSVILNPEDK